MPDLRLHHVALWVRDAQVEDCIRFYTEGLGLETVVDLWIPSPWEEIFEVPYRRLRTVMMGQLADLRSGYVELVVFDDSPADSAEPAPKKSAADPSGPPRFLLCSFFVDVDLTLARLHALGYAQDWRELKTAMTGGSGRVGTLRDPAGFMVELVDNAVGMAVMKAGMHPQAAD